MNNPGQKIIQVIFLLLFIFLLYMGRIRIWMIIFITGVVLAVLWGRFYCGWICPINTVTQAITGIKKKLGIKDISTPAFIKNPFFRYIVLALFIGIFIFIKVSGKQFPVLPALFLIGLVLSIIFSEKLWHRYLCPYGTILNLVSGKAGRSPAIDAHRCSQCGLCIAICPADAIVEEDVYHIEKKECLQCGECIRRCSKEAISF